MNEPLGRRDFLRPGNFLPSAVGTARQRDDEVPVDRIPTVTFRREAMACMFEIQIAADEACREWAARAFDWIDDLESQLTVYRDDSEVSIVNREAYENAIPIEPALFDLLSRCRQWTTATDGAFDITAGPLIRTWGFLRRQGRLPTEIEIADAMRLVGMDNVELQESDQSIRFAKPGVEINLGSVGKGFALDRVAVRLKECGLNGGLLSAGHSSVLAVGTPTWDTAWQVELRDPHSESRAAAIVRLKDRALSTTGSSQQFFEFEGRRFSHVLDPRTGWPANGVAQATAIANDAATAEAVSTAFFVNGIEWTRDYCLRNPEVSALLIAENSSANPSVFDASRSIILPTTGEAKAPR